MSYVKLFGSILDSTIWREPAGTRLVWITMLAMADKNGCVEASIPGLAARSRVTLEECEAALLAFMSPDRYSRSKEFEGRRIRETEGGWDLLNHMKYRKKASADEIRAKCAARVARWRAAESARKKAEATKGGQP